MTFTPQDDRYLRRCLALARIPGSAVSPNPPVGAVVTGPEGQVWGEGYHPAYGQPHAEVFALQAARSRGVDLRQATVYVSLEPCSHTNKQTPPCAPRLVQAGVRRVVVGALDPNPAVQGRGLALLRQAGVQVELAPDPKPYQELIRAFTVNQLQGRAYCVLKWAQKPDGALAGPQGEPIRITGPEQDQFVHRLRAEHPAILVGGETWRRDRPLLTTRWAAGPSPLRLVLTRRAAGFQELGHWPAGPEIRLLCTEEPPGFSVPSNVYLAELNFSELSANSILQYLYRQNKIGSILVEGGDSVLRIFLESGLADEAYCLMGQPRLG